VTPTFPHTVMDMPNLSTDSSAAVGLPERTFRESIGRAAYEEAGIGPEDVNPSGGLACFGESVPAQALAQVCQLTWQLRGEGEGRQVEGARIGITANQGLYGHGSAVVLAAD
jgi:acetyl-CoA acetyltransferase